MVAGQRPAVVGVGDGDPEAVVVAGNPVINAGVAEGMAVSIGGCRLIMLKAEAGEMQPGVEINRLAAVGGSLKKSVGGITMANVCRSRGWNPVQDWVLPANQPARGQRDRQEFHVQLS